MLKIDKKTRHPGIVLRGLGLTISTITCLINTIYKRNVSLYSS
jgi:hypothetical protein